LIHEVLQLSTEGRLLTDLTGPARRFCAGQQEGLLHILAPHAAAGLALMELGSGSEPDLEELVNRLLPRDDRYVHRHGSPGHGRDHVLPAVIGPALVLAVVSGRLRLGTWQSICLIDPNPDNPRRQVELSFWPG
jgi:secondary thiamine-phosphate synthase enzyme